MFLALLFCITFLQLLCYYFISSKKIAINTLWVLLLIVLVYFIAMPYVLYQIEFESYEKRPRCGLPVVGMIGACWIFGGGIALITHLSYWSVKKALRNG